MWKKFAHLSGGLFFCLLLLSACAPAKSGQNKSGSGSTSNTDTTPPFVAKHNPLPNATDVAVNANVVVHVKDTDSGVNRDSLVLTVAGGEVAPMISGGPADYTLTYTPPANFYRGQVVTVTVDALDRQGNRMPQTLYTFFCVPDNIPPYTRGHSPPPDATDATPSTNIVVEVCDADTGVDQSSMVLTVGGEQVTPIISGNATVYSLFYDPPLNFAVNQPINVTVDAVDNAGNVMVQDTYTFSCDDLVPPQTGGHSPVKNALNVARDTPIIARVLDHGIGVDVDSIQMTVAGLPVTPLVSGTIQDYTLTYTPAEEFDFAQEVIVTLDAADLSGNQMSQDSYVFTCLAGQWTAVTSMGTPRHGLAPVLLPDGKVLATGGARTDCEIYDPQTNAWNTVANMNFYRYNHTALLLPDKRVLVTGNSVWEIYDVETDQWTNSAQIKDERDNYTATQMADSRVLVSGGYYYDTSYHYLASCEIYDPANDSWQPAADMKTERWGHTATLLGDGRVLVAGGANDNKLGGCEIYDPEVDSWQVTASLGTPRYSAKTVLLSDGRVLIAGGYAGENIPSPACEIFNPQTGSWTATPNLAVARFNHTATLLADGRVLVAGGGKGGFENDYLHSCELYDPLTNTWSAVPQMSLARGYHAAILLNSGALLVTGGYNGKQLNDCEIYNYHVPRDTISPVLSDCSPSAEESGVGINSEIYCLLIDSLQNNSGASGVDKNSISIWVAGENALLSGVFQTGYRGTILPSVFQGFHVTINPENDFTPGQVVLVTVVAADKAGNQIYPTSYSFTIITPEQDHALPYTSGHNPAAGAVGISRKTNISVHLRDDGVGIDQSSLSMTVGGLVVTPVITGTPSDYTLTYDPPADYGSLQVVSVTLGAADLAGNVMMQDNWSFTIAESNTWVAAASLGRARMDHTATLLTDGRVLVAGGQGNGYLASCELYDPVTNTWSAAGNLNVARMKHTAILLVDGRVLVAGGSRNGYLSSCELYDPSTNTWSGTDSLNNSRAYHTATLLADGRVLVAGGYGNGYSANCELYDPATDTWSTANSLYTARGEHTATLLVNNHVLVTGGYNITESYLSSCEIYNPLTNTWSNVASMTNPRGDHSATLLIDDMVLVSSGYTGTLIASCELYNPVFDIWIPAADAKTARYLHTTTRLTDGRVLVAGGYNNGTLGNCEIYDPTTNIWIAAADLNAKRYSYTATLLTDGRVLVTGGYNGNNDYLTSCELYNP